MKYKRMELIFEREFEKFIKESYSNDKRTFLQKLFIRSSMDYWNSGNRKNLAKLFFIKAFKLMEVNEK